MNLLVNDRISDLPPERRPRERLEERGASALSDIELLVLMLGSGQGRRSVVTIAANLLARLDTCGDIPDLSEFTDIKGIGPARASMLAAAFEFSRRRMRPARRKITSPADVLPLLNHWSDRPQEHFIVITLNGAHEVIQVRAITKGTLNRTLVHPREVFVPPLLDRAAAIICAHNHPSGNLTPSPEDIELTSRILKAGKLMGFPMLDHVIFAEEGYYSFLENGRLENLG